MSSKQTNKLLTFFSLYIAQSVPMSLFSTLLPVLMRQDNFSLSTIGLLQLIKLPWILKVFWAPVVDKKTSDLGTYKRWIFSSEMVYAILILLVAFLDLKTNFITIFILIILSFMASATQDIATDALTALSFSRKEKSLGNSMQSMGSFAGALVGGGLLLLHYKLIGWTVLLISVSIFVMLALVPLMSYKDRRFTPKKGSTPICMKDLLLFFSQKGAGRQLIFLILCYSGLIGILAMVKPYMVDLGYKTGDIGFMFGIFGSLCGCLFSYIGGYVIRSLGRFYSRIIFACAILATTLLFYFLSLTTPGTIALYVAIFCLWASYGLSSVLVNTVAMDFLRDGREGTDFTLQTVITHLSGMIIAVCSGKIADCLGYSGLFLVETALAVTSLIYILVCFKRPARHE
ncbi:MFS transporter [uncultured Bacteroides sp.]|uniref:MFS transporter n=1 Tax=uncultured Bacteroides sp. TaxID=162156 RepID=UPI002AABD2FE|nr:MFS transporter [uncultured Bacteroides sp.]